ncbi:HelD family protein [Kytococcus sedentarius]|uniref:HelD family protein n=1 Tax=Kytococcus sedentarius TaxID=1276 RepID=UPI0035BC976C
MTTPDPRTALEAERAHLEAARIALGEMRERTLALDAQGADAQTAEYLKATLHHRALSLTDDGHSALFFGRLDLAEGHGTGSAGGAVESWHLGRRHITDAGGNPLVIDWRAPVATAFYRASSTDPMGVSLRRRFGVEDGRLTGFEDEPLLAAHEGAGDGGPADARGEHTASDLLAREIERPRTGPMRDIVSTIQPEQDEIVRADVATTVCVQGAPGTGKTAVGLHRVAWLLYTHPTRLARGGALVVGPNRAFLDHVAQVLPALGEVEVEHTTIEDLLEIPPTGTDEAPVATLKGDARMAQVLHRAIWGRVVEPTEALVVPRGARRWRVPAYEAREVVDELRERGARYAAAREMFARRLAHRVLLQMEAAGDSPDDRVADAVARSAPMKAYVKAHWPVLDPARVVFELLGDADVLARAAEDVLSPDQQSLLLWDRAPRSPRSARWSVADIALLDEAGDAVERTPSRAHVVLDEAQDLSPMQLRAVGRRASTGSLTVLGDIAQGTTPWATASWAETLRHLGAEGSHVEELVRGFRVPGAVIALAARLLPHIAPGLRAPEAVRQDPGELRCTAVAGSAEGLVAGVAEAVGRALAHEGSVGVIVPAGMVDAVGAALAAAHPEGLAGEVPRVTVLPAGLAKGLEFDRVVLAEPARIVADEPDRRTGLRRLYVVLTRAVSGLEVVHAEPLPPELD